MKIKLNTPAELKTQIGKKVFKPGIYSVSEHDIDLDHWFTQGLIRSKDIEYIVPVGIYKEPTGTIEKIDENLNSENSDDDNLEILSDNIDAVDPEQVIIEAKEETVIEIKEAIKQEEIKEEKKFFNKKLKKNKR